MHRFGTAVFLLVLTWVSAASALAQVRGEVESIGFSSYYRPECWTPMVVRLRPETNDTGTYQIQVVQEDLDRDHPIYARTVTLTGNAEGQTREQRFWMYFVPQPTESQGIHGLPDASDGLARLQERLKVFVTNAAGTKQIAQLPLTTTINKIDPFRSPYSTDRGTRLILVVSDPTSGSQPMTRDYSPPEGILGLQENVLMLPVAPTDLPEDPRGYDAVDAIVLLHVDPASLKLPTDERYRALKQYVQTGGRLVICQLPEADKMGGYSDLLPVSFPPFGEGDAAIQGNYESTYLGPLRHLAKADNEPAWDRFKGPVRLGVAEPKTGAVVDEWIDWPKGTAPSLPEHSPYIVRAVNGLGSVTWVAQDLGDRALVGSARTNWANVWDRIFDWKEEPLVISNSTPNREKDPYSPGGGIELGRGINAGMEHGQKGVAMVFVAVVFFVAYWVLAGPVAYVVLLKQERAGLSWFIFGASALAATLVTALVVKIALSGPPEIKHATVLRTGQATPSVADARIGLYIPKDGPQTVTLRQTAPDLVSYITPFPLHPQFASGNDYPAYLEYLVAIHDATSDAPPSVDIPFRRTLKKIGAHWVGISKEGLEGSAALLPPEQGYVGGTVTNVTGQNLVNVYIAFKFPVTVDMKQDWVLYVPRLAKGATIDLAAEWKAAGILPHDTASVEEMKKSVRGIIGNAGVEQQWDAYWHGLIGRGSGTGVAAETNYFDNIARSFVILSFFDRIPPIKATPDNKNRFELLRRGVRHLDMSHLLSAGAMCVVAQAEDTPLPFPLEVNGNLVGGTGSTFYQAVIPLKRQQAESAATQPVAMNN